MQINYSSFLKPSEMKKIFLPVLIFISCTGGYSQNVGIGTTTPANKLTVQTLTNDFGLTHTDGTVTVGSWIGNFQGATGGWIGTKSFHPLNLFTNNGSAQMTVLTNGNVGIGVVNPANKLQIGSVGATGFATNDFALGNGTQAFAIYQTPSSTSMGSTTDISIMPKNNGNGYLGINVAAPANKLQIGSVGATGFATNDFAIGNGTQAMAIFQTNTETLIGSTTDIILKPRNNGKGRVGINTNTPQAPLEVDDFVVTNAFYAYFKSDVNANPILSGTSGNASVSIYASKNVMALEFDARSDSRIKTIVGYTNSAKDLETINALKITNYTLKDKVQNGNKSFKKVIAQEVEKVYPQVVSKHTGFIPNVYQPANKIEQKSNGYLLTFSNNHNISKAAKKLRVLLSEEDGMQQFDIVSLPSQTQVIINATDIKTDKAFVYGEEVDDFRAVDYDGLTTLNISATQELSRLVKKQAAIINSLEKRLSALESKPISRLVGIK